MIGDNLLNMMDKVQPVTDTYEENRSDAVQELVARADLRGYVTYEDLVEVIAEDLDEKAIETLLEELQGIGIEVRQQEEEEDSLLAMPAAELEDEVFEDEDAIADINAVSADDPVGLYFRQMAQEPLLTADEEVELAKRIELGKEAQMKLHALRRLDRSQRMELQNLMDDGQAAREHLGRANTRLVVSIAKRYMG